MARGERVLRYVVLTAVLFVVFYKMSTRSIKLGPSAPVLEQTSPVQDSTSTASTSTPNSYPRENATFVSLVRNEDLWHMVYSIRQIEDRFNNRYNYDWVFLNNDEFMDDFKAITSHFVSGNAYYGKIPKEHWSYPSWIDKDKAAESRKKLAEQQVIYASSVSYRHMCRFESGFFFKQEHMTRYKYYWRVEPDVRFFCDIDKDVFKFMRENDLSYGFTISLPEYAKTITTLWDTVKTWMRENPQYIHENNLIDYISDDEGATYNLNHFWSNFEVGDLDFWRSEGYQNFFNYLDQEGGFFYERWGDAPVHSIAACLMLDKKQIHHFDDIAYYHNPFMHCPTNKADRRRLNCLCPDHPTLPHDQHHSFTFEGYSRTKKWYEAMGLPLPAEWQEHVR